MAKTATGQTEPRSQHVSDPSLQPFLASTFDAADYLNSTLPSLSAGANARPAQGSRSVPLSDLSTQLQTLLAQLNAQTTRLSNTLNQLTDEIVRSGSRLAYEVEVLRGDTAGLTDTVQHGLKKEIETFTGPQVAANTADGEANRDVAESEAAAAQPEYLERLKTLTAVRTRLDSVIKVFGDAMAWPLAPSELSGAASSIISVSAPGDSDTRDREEKGKAYVEKLRTEIDDLLGQSNDPSSLRAALVRIEELRQLAEVWKGTAEEKARWRLLDSLSKPVEEKQKALERAGKPTTLPTRGADMRYGNLESNTSRGASEGGYGFLNRLKGLRDDIYMD